MEQKSASPYDPAASQDQPGVAGVTAWPLAGASGRDYVFTVYRPGARYNAVGAVFVLGYLHPKGHVSGFMLHPLYVGQTSDLVRTLAAPPHEDCLRHGCWNCVCVLATSEDEATRRAMVRDILAAHPAPCNE